MTGAGKVVPFPSPEEPAFASGQAACLGCGHRWAAVAPVGVLRFECPACRATKGLWVFEFVPPDGVPLWQCDCGNNLFYHTPDGHMCPSCGIYQEY